MLGLKVGHYTNESDKTGATVFLFDKPVKAAYWQCGSSPATHELGVLQLDAQVTHIDGLLLSGGSAHGLASVAGMMCWLEEQGRGWLTPHGRVPIVPAAAIYDMAVGNPVPPDREQVYEACRTALENNTAMGRVGVGTGSSVGKLIVEATKMSGGLGYAKAEVAGVTVEVYIVVNSVGDVHDQSGNIIAGARYPEGHFADCKKTLAQGYARDFTIASNTTLAVIMTDADFSRVELSRIAKMATAGMAHVIAPVFTRYDGDMVFALSLGKKTLPEMVVGTMAVELVEKAIINAVAQSVVIE